MLRKETIFVITKDTSQYDFAYINQRDYTHSGKAVMFRVELEIDEDNKIISKEELPLKDYIVDEKRMKTLIKAGYLGQNVIRDSEYCLRINMDENR